MSQEYNGYTIPELTDPANIVTALQNFADDVDAKIAASASSGTGDFPTFLLMGA